MRILIIPALLAMSLMLPCFAAPSLVPRGGSELEGQGQTPGPSGQQAMGNVDNPQEIKRGRPRHNRKNMPPKKAARLDKQAGYQAKYVMKLKLKNAHASSVPAALMGQPVPPPPTHRNSLAMQVQGPPSVDNSPPSAVRQSVSNPDSSSSGSIYHPGPASSMQAAQMPFYYTQTSDYPAPYVESRFPISHLRVTPGPGTETDASQSQPQVSGS